MTKNKDTNPLFGNFDEPIVPLRIKLIACLVLGIICAGLTLVIVRTVYFDSLSERAATIAGLLDPATVAAVRDNRQNTDTDYDSIKHQLATVKTIDSSIRFIYLMSKDATGTVRFVVDSEQPGTDGYSPRGQEYPEASPALKDMFTSGRQLTEGPVSDRWGTWLSVLAPIKSDNGSVVAVVGLDTPITAFVFLMVFAGLVPLTIALLIALAFISLDRVRKRRQETLRMRGELVSIASHELRSPLTGIRWGEEMLLSAQLGEKEMKIINTMHESTLLLQESIEDILQLANLQTSASSARPKLTSANLIAIIEDILVVHQLPAQQKNVELTFGPNWPQLAMADVSQLAIKRTLNNLISNAIKYTRAGTRVVIDYEMVDGAHVFTIEDQGIGIPKAEQSKVFNGFYRASNAVHEGINGTGMGLYLSRNVIEQHNGKLWLKSEEGKGTTVYIRLPAR